MKMYIVDAFAEKVFQGNSAAVCITDSWMNEDKMEGTEKVPFGIKDLKNYLKTIF
ncbi:PhzF family phenazine biosynthesis protein [Clostridium butyricum]|nr:PhzF family phenazine biosynthesis protein [Clostridium butyricum]MDB2140024.1 PhzF family phenazine biosynthesis protein [Clostridium butyricum]